MANVITPAMTHLLQQSVSVHAVATAVEQAGASNIPMPARLHVPVQTRPPCVVAHDVTAIGGDLPQFETQQVLAQTRALEFNRVRVSVSDYAAAQAIHTPPSTVMAAQVAAQHGALLTPNPVCTQRESTACYTTYDFYVANMEDVESIAVEHAHQIYATGVGNVLGPYTVQTTSGPNGTSQVRLAYRFQTDDRFSPNLTASTLQDAAAAIQYGANVVYNQTQNTFLTSVQFGGTLGPIWPATTGSTNNVVGNILYATPPTPEQVAAWQKEDEEYRAKRVLVTQKAEALLLANLSEDQRKTWLADHYVLVRTPTGRTYQIRRGSSMNVFLMDAAGKQALRRYCAYAADPGGSLPDADQVFAQMVTLKYNEREFLAHANTWNLLDKAQTFMGQGVDADTPVTVM